MKENIFQKAIAQYQTRGIQSVANSLLKRLIPTGPQKAYIRYSNGSFVISDNKKIYSRADNVLTILESNSVEITYNGYVESNLPSGFNRAIGNKKNKTRTVSVFSDAEVIGSSSGPPKGDRGAPSIIRLNNKYILPEAIGSERPQQFQSCKRFHNIVGKNRAVFESIGPVDYDLKFDHVFLLPTPSGASFGKLYLDLCKLHTYEEYQQRTNSNPTLVIPAEFTDWMRDAFELMGYPPSSYVVLNDETLRAGCLAVPSYRARHDGGECQPRPLELQWVRDRILSNLEQNNKQYPERVYISRRDVDRRQVQNEKEVLDIISPHGFEVFVPSEHSYEEQARLFSNVDIVIGPHGSGLANVVLANDAVLVEMQSQNRELMSSFFIMANELGVGYEYVPCHRADRPIDQIVSPRHRDLIVDTNVLSNVLEDILP